MTTNSAAVAAETLKGALAALGAKDQAFAASLLAAHAKGKCSPKQAHWLAKLAERATAPKPAPAQMALTDAAGFQAIAALFAFAGGNLKRPSIRLAADDGTAFRLSVAGPASKAPGSINVTGEGGFIGLATRGERPWYGRITQAGAFEKAFKTPPTPAVVGLLTDFAADPAGVAAAQGKKAGACVFCTQGLTDKRSLEVGYGKICAAKWNLPWGAAK